MKNITSKLFFLVCILLCLIIPSTCKKLEKEMLVSTGEVTNLLTNSADVSGVVVDIGEGATQYGHCYGTAPNVTIAGSKTQLGVPSQGGFTSQLTNLTAGTKYYIKAYLSNGTETVYGKEITFTTVAASLPTLTTSAITTVTTTTAVSGGNLTSDGGAPVTARGVCWNTAAGPNTDNTKTTDGSGTGSFVSNLTGLTPGTVYYVRAYATNSVGTTYGNELTFTTNALTPVVPTLSTTAISAITQTTATSGGNITSDGGASVTAKGVCWNTSTGATVANSKTSDGTGTGIFTSNLTGLTANTTYYVRAYSTNSVGTAYGTELTFTTSAVTPVVPNLSTTAILAITQTTASSGGNITSDGGASVTAKGVCWSITSGPTTSSSKTSDGTGTGSFTSSLTGLTANTTYYLRAYAINSVGIAYGNEISFTTSAVIAVIPTLTTTAISALTPTTSASGGIISSDGGATVTACGVCWGIASGPTISGPKTIDGNGTGTFPSNINGLVPGTLYYLRAYATNSVGTAYGNEVTFTTLNPATIIYSVIGNVGSWSTDFDLSYLSTTGNVSTYKLSSRNFIQDEQFKIRKDHSWTINYGYADLTINGETTNIINTGGNLAIVSERTYDVIFAIDWSATMPTLTMNNLTPGVTTVIASSITSTTANSGGSFTNYGTSSVSAKGVCWSTTSLPTIAGNHTTDGSGTGSYISNITGLSPNTTYHIRAYATNSSGTAYGVDISFTTASATIPTLTTTPISSITSTTATSGGNISSDGGATISVSGVCWNTSANPETTGSHTTDGTSTGAFISSITGLIPNTTYHVRAYATNSVGIAYGSDLSFTTDPVNVTDIDGNVYGVVRIGTQLWFTENLRVKHYNNTESINTTSPAIEDLSSETSPEYQWSYKDALSELPVQLQPLIAAGAGSLTLAQCYSNSIITASQKTIFEDWATKLSIGYSSSYSLAMISTACTNIANSIPQSYGLLYTWYAVTDSRKVCPTGWHVPTNAEWTTLTTFLGGESIAGGKLKETGTVHWTPTNTGATNETGFTALPGGYRFYSGTYDYIGGLGYWWSSTEISTADVWYRSMDYNGPSVFRDYYYNRNGFSVRCVRDY